MRAEDKGPFAPAPVIDGPAGVIAAEIATWPGVQARAHWHLYRPTEMDGADFYVGTEELGHVHLDGEAHLAVTQTMRDVAIRDGTGHAAPWPGYENWLHVGITEDTAAEALALFRANHARLSGGQTATHDRKPT